MARRLLLAGHKVVGVDNFNDYYDVKLKRARLLELQKISSKSSHTTFSLEECDITDSAHLNHIFDTQKPQKVVNLAAQAGVRYSIENPSAYIQANLVGFWEYTRGM